MRVYIVSAVFPPEPMTSASIGRDIAVEMTKRGHEVVVFTSFPNRPAGKIVPPYRRKWCAIERRDGYTVIHTWHTLSRHPTLLSRLMENFSFGLTTILQLRKYPLPDVVYLNTWPLLAQWLSTSVLSRNGIPIVCAVKDLYPESFFGDRGANGKNLVFRLGRWLDRRIYGQSALVVPLNSVMADQIRTTRSIPYDKVKVVHDWVDGSVFPKGQSSDNDFRKRHQFGADLFLAMYVGSMTRMAGLELFIQTAERLRHRPDIRIVLVGDGARRQDVERMIKEQGLRNIQILYPLNPQDVPEVQAASDVLLLSLLPGGAEHALPSKLIYYMFSQRPILASVKHGSPPARVILDADCGNTIRQGEAEDLAESLIWMADNRSVLKSFGENARHYADAHFSKAIVLPDFCDTLEKIAKNPAPL